MYILEDTTKSETGRRCLDLKDPAIENLLRILRGDEVTCEADRSSITLSRKCKQEHEVY